MSLILYQWLQECYLPCFWVAVSDWNERKVSGLPVFAHIFLYALLSISKEKSISFTSDEMKTLALIFCLTNNDLLSIVKQLCGEYPGILVFSDNSGIKELQIKSNITKEQALERYYGAE